MMRRRYGLEIGMLVTLVACGESLPVEPDIEEAQTGSTQVVDVAEIPVDGTGGWLLRPPAGAAVPQNVASLGCPAHAYRGFGFELRFDWKDASSDTGAPTYQIVVKARTAPYAVVDGLVTESEFIATFCNAFVIDRNLDGWEWKVSALAASGELLWSETRAFRFEPCRQGGVPCSAPVGS